ncbi:MAG: hypothetical protein D6741_04395 [Planctomycetota bacterium]|nr:MAG: hypothetical protein D6741_04395 [Planctomycetota bacterium]
MDTCLEETSNQHGTRGGRFVWWPVLLLLSLGLGAGVGYAEWLVGRYWAPWLLLPALTGLAGGIVWCGMVRLMPVAGRRALLWTAAVIALGATVLAPHWMAYRELQAQITPETQLIAKMTASTEEPIIPETFGEFLAWSAKRGRFIGRQKIVGVWVWASWALDAILVGVGFGLPVRDLMRKPYCRTCRTWLRPILARNLSLREAERVAARCSLPSNCFPGNLHEPLRLRVLGCRGACGGFVLQFFSVGHRRPLLEESLSSAMFAQLNDSLAAPEASDASPRRR